MKQDTSNIKISSQILKNQQNNELLTKIEIEKFLKSIQQLCASIQKLQDDFIKGHFATKNKLQTGLEQIFNKKLIQDLELKSLKTFSTEENKTTKLDTIIQNITTFKDQPTQISLDLSDQFEKMPVRFKQLIQKSHHKLENLIDMVNYPETSKLWPRQKLYFEYVLFNTPISCKICFQFVSIHASNMKFHMIQHQELISDQIKDFKQMKCPYNFQLQELICIMGCGFKTQTKSQMRMHFILQHSFDQLRIWGINRDFLKLQEGIIDREQFFQINKSQKKLDPLI